MITSLILATFVARAEPTPPRIRPYAPKLCQSHLMSEERRRVVEQWVRVNDIFVSGEQENPTPQVMEHLEITPDVYRGWRQGKRKVISLGEGMSGLVPKLRFYGVDATGIDIWYDAGDLIPNNRDGLRMKAYIHKYRRMLRAGDARRLDWPDASVDVVLSYKLFNNFGDDDEFQRALAEVTRVLKPGGEAFLYIPLEESAAGPQYEDFRRAQGARLTDFRERGYLLYFKKAY